MDGQVTNDGAKLFKVVKPTVEGTCPPPTTTTTTTTIPSCTFLLELGVPLGTGNGELSHPLGVATDRSGNVYVADRGNNRIQKFDASGTFLTTWGSPGSGNGQFDLPYGVAIDGSGNVYVVDSGNDRIQKFDTSGAFLTTWGSAGSGNGQFNRPAGVATDGSGNVYVADGYSEPFPFGRGFLVRIQKFDASGTFLTSAATNRSPPPPRRPGNGRERELLRRGSVHQPPPRPEVRLPVKTEVAAATAAAPPSPRIAKSSQITPRRCEMRIEMRTKIGRLALGAGALLLLGRPRVAVAQFSHFQCGKFKDKIPRATYTADEFFFGSCIIKVPAKQICTLTSKTNVTPAPPGGGPTTDILDAGVTFTFLCYKQKCPKQLTSEFTFKDQFGTHSLPAGTTARSRLLCAPASPSGAFLDDPSMF